MSRVSGCLWLGVALVLALVAGGVAFVTLQRATVTKAVGAPPITTTTVVVAAHPMPIGTLLSDRDITVQSFPAGALPAGSITNAQNAIGQITTVDMDAGEMVLTHHLTQPDITGSNMAFTLPEGLVGITLSADDLMSQIALLKTGDHVDILYSLEAKASGQSTVSGANASKASGQYTFGALQNVIVVGVVASALKDKPADDAAAKKAAEAMPARAYILALNPQDALILKYLKDADAVMDLAIRNIADESDHGTEPVDQQYLIDKYQLKTR